MTEITHQPEFCEDCGSLIVDKSTNAKYPDEPQPGAYFDMASGRWQHECDEPRRTQR